MKSELQNTQGENLIEEFTLPLMSDEVHHLLTDPSFCVLPASPQIDSAFLFLTSCMPSTAEYVLCALLLAGALGGGGAVVMVVCVGALGWCVGGMPRCSNYFKGLSCDFNNG